MAALFPSSLFVYNNQTFQTKHLLFINTAGKILMIWSWNYFKMPVNCKMLEYQGSDLRDWVYTLETETLFSLVSISRLKILESRDRDFDETFFWLFETETELFIFSRPRLRLDESQNRDFSRPRLFHYDF